MAVASNVKATAPMDDTNHRSDVGCQFRNQDRLKDERFDTVLIDKQGAEEIHEVCPISSAAMFYDPHKVRKEGITVR
jgi:hypothetical protein